LGRKVGGTQVVAAAASSSKASIGLPVNASKGNRGPTQQHRAALRSRR